MKKNLFTLTILITMLITSCADSISDIEKTYQYGIERAHAATSPEELTQITIDIRNYYCPLKIFEG